ncbi:hypothetical protein GSI_01849 [Ganoderma sinense ZZ0214-1]|uniref:Transporter n=1 Tax=Ganoderma sinense ZZ0214-1 TaxID=1077348 RepID=A0A2G8SQZ5_9APHY|nr:hypothetical protein GSI_01849 [Ganoderma sinense ZZ0214-1]
MATSFSRRLVHVLVPLLLLRRGRPLQLRLLPLHLPTPSSVFHLQSNRQGVGRVVYRAARPYQILGPGAVPLLWILSSSRAPMVPDMAMRVGRHLTWATMPRPRWMWSPKARYPHRFLRPPSRTRPCRLPRRRRMVPRIGPSKCRCFWTFRRLPCRLSATILGLGSQVHSPTHLRIRQTPVVPLVRSTRILPTSMPRTPLIRSIWRLPRQLSGRRSRRSTLLVRSRFLIRYHRLRRFFLILACSRMGLDSYIPVSLVPCGERGERKSTLFYWFGFLSFSHLSYPNGLPAVSLLPLFSSATYCHSLPSVVSSSGGLASWIALCRCRWLVILLSVTAFSVLLSTTTFVFVVPAVVHVVPPLCLYHVQFSSLTLYSHSLYIDMAFSLYAPYLVVCALTSSIVLGVWAFPVGSYGGSRARAV